MRESTPRADLVLIRAFNAVAHKCVILLPLHDAKALTMRDGQARHHNIALVERAHHGAGGAKHVDGTTQPMYNNLAWEQSDDIAGAHEARTWQGDTSWRLICWHRRYGAPNGGAVWCLQPFLAALDPGKAVSHVNR